MLADRARLRGGASNGADGRTPPCANVRSATTRACVHTLDEACPHTLTHMAISKTPKPVSKTGLSFPFLMKHDLILKNSRHDRPFFAPGSDGKGAAAAEADTFGNNLQVTDLVSLLINAT